jgi:predicted acyltransferase
MTTRTASEQMGATPSFAAPRQWRLLSVDVLRGLCVAGMVLVNFPADWVLRYPQLSHADWDGSTATDMIFPMFLFLAGFSMTLSCVSRTLRGQSRLRLAWHVVIRSFLLMAMGLLLNAFPDFDWHTLHIPGVLQRIALCYLVGGLFTLVTATVGAGRRFSVRAGAVALFAVCVLMGVWALIRFVPVPGYGAWRFDHNCYLGAVIDRAIFGNRHLSSWGGPERMWDADGLLSCVTSIPNLLLGVLAAAWIGRPGTAPGRKVVVMALFAAALIGVALLLNPYLVINRKIWTDSFTLLSGGVSLGIFAATYYLLDVVPERIALARWRGLLTPALVYGSNAILGFAIYTVLLGLQGLYRIPGAHGPANWMPGPVYAELCRAINPYNASLVYALVMTAVVCVLLWPLYLKRIFLRL